MAPLEDAAAWLDVAPEVVRLLVDARVVGYAGSREHNGDGYLVVVDDLVALREGRTVASAPTMVKALQTATGLWTYLRTAAPTTTRTHAMTTHRPLWVRTGSRAGLRPGSHAVAVRPSFIPDWLMNTGHVAELTTLPALNQLLNRSPWAYRRLVVPYESTRTGKAKATTNQESFSSMIAPPWLTDAMGRLHGSPVPPSEPAPATPLPDPWAES